MNADTTLLVKALDGGVVDILPPAYDRVSTARYPASVGGVQFYEADLPDIARTLAPGLFADIRSVLDGVLTQVATLRRQLADDEQVVEDLDRITDDLVDLQEDLLGGNR